MTRARVAWTALAVVAAALAALALSRWVWAVALDGPVLYGEGAVAHAALLTRDGLAYGPLPGAASGPLFAAANYPPLYFHVAALGDPFVAGRTASVLATIFVAGAIGWRARAAGVPVAFALGLAWLATVPVMVWGAAVKPDLLALALTVAGVLAVPARRNGPVVAGVLLALAVWAKPTAALPAIALAAWAARRGRSTLVPYAAAALVVGALLLTMDLPRSGPGALFAHVVVWNVLPWSGEQAALLVVVALATLLVPLAAAVAARDRGPLTAYLVGAIGIVALGGRQGSTINYLLDLSAASALVAASLAPRLRVGALYPIAAAAQLLVAAALLDPFGVLPGRAPSTGAWGDPARIAAARSLPPGPALVEDAGLLVANGKEPLVDDLFLWSRLRERADAGDLAFPEGERVLDAVSRREFTSVVSETDLARIDAAPAYERARWHPDLVRAVLTSYALERRAGGLWIYAPR